MRLCLRIAVWMMVFMPLADLPVCWAAEPLPRSILVLHQSDVRGPFYYQVFSALRSTVNVSARWPVTIYVESLDLSRFTGPAYEESLQAHFRVKYRDRPIGVVVAIGSATLEYVLRWRTTLWPDIPVVFAMVDEPTFARLSPPPDVTGKIIKLTLRDMMTTARAVVPDLKRIAFVGDAWEGQTVFRHFVEEIRVAAADVEVIDLVGLTMRELRERVALLPDKTAILYTSIYSDGEGTYYPPADALVLIAEIASRPIVIAIETFLGRGGVGGFVMTASAIGGEAAQLALRVLNGEKAANIPVAVGDVPRPVFDWRQLKRFRISEARLPPGSEVRFRELTVWEQYRWQIMLIAAALLIQTALIVVLFYEHRYRRMAEAASRSAMGKFAHMNCVATAGELSASIAHEVNQPLGAIVANASAGLRWLSNPVPDLDEVRTSLKGVVSAGNRASEIVGSLRAMFKMGSEITAPLDLNDVIEEVLRHLLVELQNQGIMVQTALSKSLPLVLGHSGQLQQVIWNLVRNAADAMASVSGRARLLRVESAIHDPDGVLLSVEDSGTGIDPKDIDRIFDSFFTTKPQGMGMGLSICRSIIEAHGGRLTASSGHSLGSVFQIILPTDRPGIGRQSVSGQTEKYRHVRVDSASL